MAARYMKRVPFRTVLVWGIKMGYGFSLLPHQTTISSEPSAASTSISQNARTGTVSFPYRYEHCALLCMPRRDTPYQSQDA